MQGTPASSYTVTATAGAGEVRTINCSEGDYCYLLFEEFHPREVIITYSSDDQTMEKTFSPSTADRGQMEGGVLQNASPVW